MRTIGEQMYEITNIKIKENDNPKFVKTRKMYYTQDGIDKTWEIALTYDSVSIFLIDEVNNRFILVKQFRPPVFLKNKDGFTYEMCAGIVDKEIPLIEIAREEALEECGYDIPLENITKCNELYSGVGFSGSKQTLYFAHVNDDMRVNEGGGIGDETLEVFFLDIDKSKKFISDDSLIKTPGLAYSIIKYFYDKEH